MKQVPRRIREKRTLWLLGERNVFDVAQTTHTTSLLLINLYS